jgi:hypothetical protein
MPQNSNPALQDSLAPKAASLPPPPTTETRRRSAFARLNPAYIFRGAGIY